MLFIQIGEYDLTGVSGPKTYKAPNVNLHQYHMAHYAGVVYFTDQKLLGVYRWGIRDRVAYRMVRTRLKVLGVVVYDADRTNGQSVCIMTCMLSVLVYYLACMFGVHCFIVWCVAGTTACSSNNGGCSYVCLPVPMGRQCVCMKENTTSCMPRIVASPTSATVKENSKVTLRCKLKPAREFGVPYSAAIWYLDGRAIAKMSGSDLINDVAILTVAQVNSSSAGVYTCIVSNYYGNVTSQPATLSLTSKRDFILLSDDDLIRAVDVSSTVTTTVDLFTITTAGNVSAVDTDVSAQTVFYTAGANGTIYRSNRNGSLFGQWRGVGAIGALTADWIGKHIYFTESDLKRISLVSMDFSYFYVVVKNVTLVDTLVVDPLSG